MRQKTKYVYVGCPVHQIYDNSSAKYFYSVEIIDDSGNVNTHTTIKTENKDASFENLKNESIAFLPADRRSEYLADIKSSFSAVNKSETTSRYSDGSTYTREADLTNFVSSIMTRRNHSVTS